MERGKLIVERVEGKSTLTRCFSKYPFKFIVPKKVGSSQTDAVWIYTITYGGGIVSGDSIAFDVTVADGCNAVLTTQSSTKVYKSIESKCSEQVLELLMQILLEQGSHGSIADRMNDYQAIAMIVLLGPKLKHIQNQIEEDVRKIMSQRPSISSSKPNFIASCSRFGPKGMGVVIRVASTTTEAIYNFLQHQLATMEELLGAPPYR
ncbi:urease accessory protein D isoform X6 [Salvia miltiorrhiza]|uniref:urease accessory protein D isoform X6 n=1 Tax=Salvia miltiorrhiza TaxID=226208 RepID=UPI0025AC3533|nr:urease accessory protein D isoform X6 [Salvia miltiorrhiza]